MSFSKLCSPHLEDMQPSWHLLWLNFGTFWTFWGAVFGMAAEQQCVLLSEREKHSRESLDDFTLKPEVAKI